MADPKTAQSANMAHISVTSRVTANFVLKFINFR